ncbi:AsmA family protein [Legionella shakespearei]|uniref:Putative asmA protein n=1 Tax=Legionella shakespearei DSM 23087 TaxID=1122169 RepID=A0A0W0Z131_9GAMM|nr:AsmA family protein [Legionella shakespearei]KTD62824.1 putative asmA protein [Legionella shakespearei DSM 23087]
MKLLGKILLGIFALILFASATLWILAKNIKPETIKQLVNGQITAITHKKSQINGDIFWQIFPRPGLKFSNIQIGDEKANENYFLTADTLLFNLKITPLFKGDFVFSEINVDGLKLQINKDAAQIAAPDETKIKNPRELSAHQFAIQNLSLSHGQITINSNGHRTTFKNIQVAMEQFNLQQYPFPIQLKARLIEAGPLSIAKANINFKGRLTLASTVINELQKGIVKSSAEGQLAAQNILLNQFIIKNVHATVKTDKSGITFNPFTLSLYNGESVGDMNYNIANQQITLNQTATNLDGKQLMTALSGRDLVSGTLDYSIHATVPLHKPFIESINSKGHVTIKDGQIHNINLNQLLTNLKDKLNNLTLGNSLQQQSIKADDWNSETSNMGSTAFKLANIQYQVQNGLMNSDTLLLQTDTLQVNGQGSLNLINQELSAKLKAILNSNNSDSSMQKLQQSLGGSFPLEISGTLTRPLVLPDFKVINPLLGSLLKNTLKKPVDKIKGQLKELLH